MRRRFMKPKPTSRPTTASKAATEKPTPTAVTSYERRYDYPSLMDYISFIKTHNRQLGAWSSSEDSDTSFRGTATIADAYDLALNGWPEGADKVKALAGGLFTSVAEKIVIPKIVWDVEGIMFDIPRILEGEPECWYRFEDEEEVIDYSGKVITILYNIVTSAGISTDVIIARGAAIYALAELLEYAGRKVEVILAAPYGYKWNRDDLLDTCYITIKQADQPIDQGRFAYCLIHPSMQRRITRAWIERVNGDIAQGGYGSVTDCEVKGDINIGGAYLSDPQWETPESTIRWIIAKLIEQGVTISADSQ